MEKQKNKDNLYDKNDKFLNKYKFILDDYILQILNKYLNDNRVNSAISKIGKPNINSNNFKIIKSKIVGEVCKDILISFQIDESILYNKLKQSNKYKIIKKYISFISNKYINSYNF